ncbi:UTP--glucose-1-phosphate uridylyltransferase [bacterium]|nr:UTP--glucose-1-phosphate uridylyltransferase [bacterium]
MSGGTQKILIYLPEPLIEMVHAMPIFAYVRDHFPLSEITVLAPKRHAALMRGVEVDHLHFFQGRTFFAPSLDNDEDVISFVQKGVFDIAINCCFSFMSAYALYQGRVPKRLGFAHPWASVFFTDKAKRDDYKSLLSLLGIKVGEWKPVLVAAKWNHHRLHIGITLHKDHKISKQKWYENFADFIRGEIPYVQLSVQDCLGRRRSTLGLSEQEIDLIHNLDVLVTDNEEVVEVAKALSTPVADISGFARQDMLLPEDFFYKIKEAMLKPLQERISTDTFFDFVPIVSGNKVYKEEENKKVGVVILAGGMGRRLGYHRPKGLLPIGDQCLFDVLLDKSKGAEKIAILTSPVTFEETKMYAKDRGIDLLEKKVYPTLEGDGVSPEGNGALFDALVYSRFWKEWKELDLISVLAVDNPLANPLDPVLLSTKKELAVIGVERDRKESTLGVLCKKRSSLVVREYFTLGKDGLDGLGYSGNFAATPAFFERVAGKELPFYRVEKKGKVFYERLVIDAFYYAKSFDIIQKNRAECFFPIKEKKDLLSYCEKMNLEVEGEKHESGIFR